MFLKVPVSYLSNAYCHNAYLCLSFSSITPIWQLTCIVLEHGHRNLLQPKSIWNAEGTPKDFSLVEQILHMESLEVSLILCEV